MLIYFIGYLKNKGAEVQKTREEKAKVRKFFWLTILIIFFFLFMLLGIMGVFSHAFGSPVSFSEQTDSGLKTYRNKKLGIEFKYPKILKVKEERDFIRLEHHVSFKHQGSSCWAGSSQTLDKIQDFLVIMEMVEKTPNEIIESELLEVNRNGVLILKHDVRVTYGRLDGFRVFAGSYNCARYTHIFQLTERHADPFRKEKFLIVYRWPASEFRKATDEELAVFSLFRKVILPEREERIFQEILTSFKWESQKH